MGGRLSRIAVLFGIGVFRFAGPHYGGEFFAGYAFEYALSIDNSLPFINGGEPVPWAPHISPALSLGRGDLDPGSDGRREPGRVTAGGAGRFGGRHG